MKQWTTIMGCGFLAPLQAEHSVELSPVIYPHRNYHLSSTKCFWCYRGACYGSWLWSNVYEAIWMLLYTPRPCNENIPCSDYMCIVACHVYWTSMETFVRHRVTVIRLQQLPVCPLTRMIFDWSHSLAQCNPSEAFDRVRVLRCLNSKY